MSLVSIVGLEFILIRAEHQELYPPVMNEMCSHSEAASPIESSKYVYIVCNFFMFGYITLNPLNTVEIVALSAGLQYLN